MALPSLVGFRKCSFDLEVRERENIAKRGAAALEGAIVAFTSGIWIYGVKIGGVATQIRAI